MSAFLTLFAAYWLLNVVNTLITWGLAASLGVTIKEFLIGSGHTLYKGERVTLNLIPLGINMHFASTEEGDATRGSFNTRSALVRLAIVLGPYIILTGLGVLLVPSRGFQGFTETFSQLVLGAILPFTKAQVLIRSALEFAKTRPFHELLGMTTLKLSAVNLFPLIPSAGHTGLMIILTEWFGTGPWQDRLNKILFWPYLVIWCSWIIAFVTYVVKNAS